MILRTALPGLLAACIASGASAQGTPPIRDITFEGNEVTQPKVMLREMVLGIGDPADAERIERSRQAVQDLGLFRAVSVRQEPMDDGVRLVFTVKEKWYILPLPRTDASSDGGYAYGVQLRWNNVWGLDHSFIPYFERRQPSEGSNDPERRGEQTRARFAYYAPYLLDSQYHVGFAASYYQVPYLAPLVYEETTRSVGFGISRKLSEGPGSQGWRAGMDINRSDNVVTGLDAERARSEGRELSLGASLGYRDLRFRIYSDEGVDAWATVRSAGRAYGSDYHSTTWEVFQAWYLPIGSAPHQTLHFIGTAGARHGGAPFAQEQFSLGGAENLRGFEPETAQGDAFYLFSMEYLRPIYRNSVRGVVMLNAGNAFAEPGDADLHTVLVSAGLGVRFRVQAFVNVNVELGFAWPLNGGAPRFFAGKI